MKSLILLFYVLMFNLVMSSNISILSNNDGSPNFDTFFEQKLSVAIDNNENEKIIFLCKEFTERNDVELYEKGKAFALIGDCYRMLNDYRNSLEYLNKAKSILKGKDLGKTLNYMGKLHISTYSYQEALISLFEAEKINYDEGAKTQLAVSYGLISIIYEEEENSLAKSLVYNKKALDIFEELNDTYSIISTLVNRGTIFINLEEYDKAIIIFNQAKDMAETLSDNYLKGIILLNLSESYYFIGDYTEAEIQANRSLKHFNDNATNYSLAATYYTLGRIYSKQNKYVASKSALNKSNKISETYGLIEFLEKNNLELALLYESQNDFKNSLVHYKRYDKFSDSIAKINNYEKIERLKSNFDLKNAEHELTLKTAEIEKIENEKNITKLKYTSIILFSGLLLIILLFVIRSYSFKSKKLELAKKNLVFEKQINELLKKEQKREAEFKSKEIRDFAINIKSKIEILDAVKQEISLIHKKAKELNVKDELKKIIITLNQNIERNKTEIKFHNSIDKVHNTFQNKLIDKFPNLSKKEVKIAMYLVLGLSSKEIGNELGIIEQTVNNYRRSIRKKLNLDKKQDLSSYLKKI